MFGSKKKRIQELEEEQMELRHKLEETRQNLEALEKTLEETQGLELAAIKAKIAESEKKYQSEILEAEEVLESLDQQKTKLEEQISSLQADLVNVREVQDLQNVALYDFEHPAERSVELADELKALRAEIRQKSKIGIATRAADMFLFNQSAAQGRKFIKDMSRTMLAAYNSEAENGIKAVKAGGYQAAKARLDRIRDRIVKSGAMIDLEITTEYHQLRLKELALAERHLMTVKIEKELERERKAELREQKKAEAELRREQERLEKERRHYEAVLKELRAQGREADARELELKLADVEKAIADVDYRQANIRAGYVYVISNIGSFGPEIIKIGMTRRLEPMDRVRELGDASVPFNFDVHAMFFADDAVGVEAELHRRFANRRVNRVNLRREYFYATPSEVKKELADIAGSLLEFTDEPEAEQFRVSQSIAQAQ